MIDLIEDDEAVRLSTQTLLEAHGYSARAYASAEAFLAAHKKSDCLLVNQHMTGISGLVLIERLRRRGDNTPAVIITGCENANIYRQAERLSVRVLTKPLRCEELFKAIEEITKPPTSQARLRGFLTRHFTHPRWMHHSSASPAKAPGA